MIDKEVWKKVWGGVDTSYSQDKIISQWDMFEKMKIKFLENLFPRSGESGRQIKSLECGCGGATVSVYFSKKNYKIFAFDFVNEALQLAKRNFRKAGGEGELLFADVENIPMKNNVFDVVMSFGLIEHFHEDKVDAQIKEMARVLKPGGLLFLDIYGRGYHLKKKSFQCDNIGRIFNFIACFTAGLLKSLSLKEAYRRAIPIFVPEFYDSHLPLEFYERIVKSAGIYNVSARGNRPFPALCLPRFLGNLYIGLMKFCEPFWTKFDNSSSKFSRYWGAGWWLYGTKGETGN